VAPRIPCSYSDILGCLGTEPLGHLKIVVEQAHPADSAQGRAAADTQRSAHERRERGEAICPRSLVSSTAARVRDEGAEIPGKVTLTLVESDNQELRVITVFDGLPITQIEGRDGTGRERHGRWKVPVRWTRGLVHRTLDIAERCPHLPPTRRRSGIWSGVRFAEIESGGPGALVSACPFPFPARGRDAAPGNGTMRHLTSS
jgi:hypothetical protein